jgi:N-acetylneuraminic acid mutarotase
MSLTLVAAISFGFAKAQENINVNENRGDDIKLPELPLAITSFGGDRAGDALFIYGGHHGRAHHYSTAGQSGDLLRFDLKNGTKWEKIATGPKLQGLALIARGEKLYRIGGFQARNKEGDDHDLWSVADCQVFDLKTGKWEASIDMPTPRSSFDAVLAGDTIYVVGGWAMEGEKESVWRDDAYALDLSAENPHWKPIAKPPFQRRAMCVGARESKIFVIGGMQPKGKITTKTAVYDPQKNQWSEGPALPGEDMEGFGAACCTVDDQLYVSTSGGNLLKLSADAKSWQPIGKTPGGRFFHQMLPLSKRQLISIAGAHMEEGRFKDIQVLPLDDKQ